MNTRNLSLGALAALLAIVALVVPNVASAATMCADADLVPTSDNGVALRNATLCLLNEERAKAGLKPLVSNTQLRRAAQKHSLDMVRESFFDHTSPEGSTLMSRVRKGTAYLRGALNFALGENIAWGSGTLSTPANTVEGWMESPEHKKNILNRRYRHIGIGVAIGAPGIEGGGPAATYTTDFGTRILR
jgi:uncharacterized protein YkwD